MYLILILLAISSVLAQGGDGGGSGGGGSGGGTGGGGGASIDDSGDGGGCDGTCIAILLSVFVGLPALVGICCFLAYGLVSCRKILRRRARRAWVLAQFRDEIPAPSTGAIIDANWIMWYQQEKDTVTGIQASLKFQREETPSVLSALRPRDPHMYITEGAGSDPLGDFKIRGFTALMGKRVAIAWTKIYTTGAGYTSQQPPDSWTLEYRGRGTPQELTGEWYYIGRQHDVRYRGNFGAKIIATA